MTGDGWVGASTTMETPWATLLIRESIMLSLAPLGKVHDPPFELNLPKSLSSKDVSWVEIGLVILEEMQNVKNL